MDLDDLNIFEKYSTGTFALVLGMAIIGTITYVIYVLAPLYGPDRSIFLLSFLVIILGVFIPFSFFIEMLFDDIPDVVGKFVAGILFAGIVWTSYHAATSEDVVGNDLVLYMVLPAFFSILTALIAVRGVLIPTLEESSFTVDWDEGEESIIDDEGDEEHPLDDEDDEELFPEEIDDSW